MAKKLYAERDAEEQGDFYMDHLAAMTAERLHSKCDIAKELAHRDIMLHEAIVILKEMMEMYNPRTLKGDELRKRAKSFLESTSPQIQPPEESEATNA